MSMRKDMNHTFYTMRGMLKVYRVMEETSSGHFLPPYRFKWLVRMWNDMKCRGIYPTPTELLLKGYNERHAKDFPWKDKETKSESGFTSFVKLSEATAFISNRVHMKRFRDKKWVVIPAWVPTGTKCIYGFRARHPHKYPKVINGKNENGLRRKENLRVVQSEQLQFGAETEVLFRINGARYTG